jgi:hypothetical protein
MLERRMRELGGVQALVVVAFAEHSADGVHTLVDGLAEAAILRAQATTTWWIRQRQRVQQRHCSTQLSGLRRGSLKRSVSTLAVAPLLCRRPQRSSPRQAAGANSAGISNDARVEIHTQDAGRSQEHQLQLHLGAPRQPPGCRRLALGLLRERGWVWLRR